MNERGNDWWEGWWGANFGLPLKLEGPRPCEAVRGTLRGNEAPQAWGVVWWLWWCFQIKSPTSQLIPPEPHRSQNSFPFFLFYHSLYCIDRLSLHWQLLYLFLKNVFISILTFNWPLLTLKGLLKLLNLFILFLVHFIQHITSQLRMRISARRLNIPYVLISWRKLSLCTNLFHSYTLLQLTNLIDTRQLIPIVSLHCICTCTAVALLQIT